jgi:nucleotide-binding universal stress UspA family protein
MTKPLVVGVDDSPASAAALRWAATEALRTGADVLALHAWMPGRGRAAVHEPDLRGERSAIRQNLVGWVCDTLDPLPEGLRVRVDVKVGRPAPVLLGLAGRATALVLGFDDLSAERPRGTARRCLTAARCPVVVVRTSDGTAEGDPVSLLGVAP